jgi:membrane-associated PAP2 superfamily phosphatase
MFILGLAESSPIDRRGLLIGLGLGGLMGLYQIARGEHMLSHTLATLGIAWFLSVSISFAD